MVPAARAAKQSAVGLIIILPTGRMPPANAAFHRTPRNAAPIGADRWDCLRLPGHYAEPPRLNLGESLPRPAACSRLDQDKELLSVKSYRVRWARNQALPEISRLIDEEKYGAACSLALVAEKRTPNDPIRAKLWPNMSETIFVRTNPAGADVYRKDYNTPGAPWEYVGRSPLENIRIPRVSFRW